MVQMEKANLHASSTARAEVATRGRGSAQRCGAPQRLGWPVHVDLGNCGEHDKVEEPATRCAIRGWRAAASGQGSAYQRKKRCRTMESMRPLLLPRARRLRTIVTDDRQHRASNPGARMPVSCARAAARRASMHRYGPRLSRQPGPLQGTTSCCPLPKCQVACTAACSRRSVRKRATARGGQGETHLHHLPPLRRRHHFRTLRQLRERSIECASAAPRGLGTLVPELRDVALEDGCQDEAHEEVEAWRAGAAPVTFARRSGAARCARAPHQ